MTTFQRQCKPPGARWRGTLLEGHSACLNREQIAVISSCKTMSHGQSACLCALRTKNFLTLRRGKVLQVCGWVSQHRLSTPQPPPCISALAGHPREAKSQDTRSFIPRRRSILLRLAALPTTLSTINGVSGFLRARKKKQPLPLCSAFLDPHPDSPLVLSAQLEAPADIPDLVQGPEVQVHPDFREPPRCSSRCQQAARATHSREDTRVAVAAGPGRACVKRREPSGRASDDRECCCGRERGEHLSQDRSHSVAARRGVV